MKTKPTPTQDECRGDGGDGGRSKRLNDAYDADPQGFHDNMNRVLGYIRPDCIDVSEVLGIPFVFGARDRVDVYVSRVARRLGYVPSRLEEMVDVWLDGWDFVMVDDSRRAKSECMFDLPEEWTKHDLKAAYRKLAIKHHPDKAVHRGVSPEKAHKKFCMLANAYERLKARFRT